MIEYRKITNILLVTDTISIYRKNRYQKCQYIDIKNISTIFLIYRPTSITEQQHQAQKSNTTWQTSK